VTRGGAVGREEVHDELGASRNRRDNRDIQDGPALIRDLDVRATDLREIGKGEGTGQGVEFHLNGLRAACPGGGCFDAHLNRRDI
jgi:hypothetical protein